MVNKIPAVLFLYIRCGYELCIKWTINITIVMFTCRNRRHATWTHFFKTTFQKTLSALSCIAITIDSEINSMQLCRLTPSNYWIAVEFRFYRFEQRLIDFFSGFSCSGANHWTPNVHFFQCSLSLLARSAPHGCHLWEKFAISITNQ